MTGRLSGGADMGLVFEPANPKRRLMVDFSQRIYLAMPGKSLLPENVARLWGRQPPPEEIYGSYEVCPIPSHGPAWREHFVCINAARDLKGVRRDKRYP